MRAPPVTIVTGASAGIGSALAQVFSGKGHELVLVARRAQALQALADDLAAQGRPAPLVLALDLEQTGAVARIGEALAARGLAAQYIVNNAGFGLLGLADVLSRDEQLAMIDLNVRTLVDLLLAFVDDLAPQGRGILNVASGAGVRPAPG